MDYDFITTCNWTTTGTYTLKAYRGGETNVVTTYYASVFYRKKGTTTWTALNSSGQMVVDSTGEWEVANDWNKSGYNCLTHGYREITAIDKCTSVYFDETSLGTNVGNYFMIWCWNGCTSLTSMPVGFNLPTGITTIGSFFIYGTWNNCTSLTSMPSGFNIPSGITTAGFSPFYQTWYNCTLLKADGYTENIDFDYASTDTFGGTCPITPDSPTAGSSVAVNRPQPVSFIPRTTWF